MEEKCKANRECICHFWKKLLNLSAGKKNASGFSFRWVHFLVPDKSSVLFMHIPQEEKPVVKVKFGLSSLKMANYYCNNKTFSCDLWNS